MKFQFSPRYSLSIAVVLAMAFAFAVACFGGGTDEDASFESFGEIEVQSGSADSGFGLAGRPGAPGAPGAAGGFSLLRRGAESAVGATATAAPAATVAPRATVVVTEDAMQAAVVATVIVQKSVSGDRARADDSSTSGSVSNSSGGSASLVS